MGVKGVLKQCIVVTGILLTPGAFLIVLIYLVRKYEVKRYDRQKVRARASD